jgi:uncharacterized protein (TIGR02284 family)
MISTLGGAHVLNGAIVVAVRKTEKNMDTKNDRTELHNIHDLLVDSRKGYMEAAERAEHSGVKSLLMAFAHERDALESEVDNELRKQDPDAEHRDGGTIKGDLHRAWMDLRDSLSKSDNANVLSECERGEEYLLMRYDEVLKKDDLQPGTRTLATAQRAQVQKNMDRIKDLRKQFDRIEA